MDPVQTYLAFARSFEVGNFSAVARELGTSQSAVSKQIAMLEKSLGVQLFARTTRRLTPTHEGRRLYESVRPMLDAAESLRAVTGLQARATGELRVSMPIAYGRRVICPLIPAFLAQHPLVQLDVRLTDQVTDLVEEGSELGIRIGALTPSTLVARSLGVIEMVVVATPVYLESHAPPDVPTDLTEHRCVLYTKGGHWSRWEFESESGRHAVDVDGPVRISDPEAVLELVHAHLGVGLLPSWITDDGVRSGSLRRLLPDYEPLPLQVNVVYPQTRFLPARARAFIDFLVEAL